MVEDSVLELRKMGSFVMRAIEKMTHHEKHEFLISIFGLRKLMYSKMLWRRMGLGLRAGDV